MAAISFGGQLAVPSAAVGVVLVARSGPHPARDALRLQVADFLHHAGLATLVAPLAGEEEGSLSLDRAAGRVTSALAWIAASPRLGGLSIGVLADGPAVGAVLLAMAYDPERVSAFVGCGGRPDGAAGALARVHGPTLLVVGGEDEGGLAAARSAVSQLPPHAELAIIDDAIDPLDESEAAGTLAWLSRRWFLSHLTVPVG